VNNVRVEGRLKRTLQTAELLRIWSDIYATFTAKTEHPSKKRFEHFYRKGKTYLKEGKNQPISTYQTDKFLARTVLLSTGFSEEMQRMSLCYRICFSTRGTHMTSVQHWPSSHQQARPAQSTSR
jgi:hypothetical protein